MGYKEVVVAMQTMLNDTNPAKIQGMNAIYQFELAGDGCQTFHIKVAEGEMNLIEEAAEKPDVTLVMSVVDFEEMISGKVSTTSAFMSGKLKIKGDLSLLIKLSTFIEI